MATAVLPYQHPARRSADITDLPGVMAEFQRLYDAARCSTLESDTIRHCERILRSVAALHEAMAMDARLAALEDSIGATTPHALGSRGGRKRAANAINRGT